jgi:Na+/H+-dicarboxylate symporter
MFHALTDNSLILQIIIVAIILGFAIIKAGDAGDRVAKLFDSAFAVMMQFAQLIMRFAPLGVFCLIAVMINQFGTQMLLELFTLVLTIYIGCILNALIVYTGLLSFIARLNPWPFFRGLADAMIFAFSTTSSSATLPVTMRCSQQNHGVAKSISEFVLPLGATINMNGLAVYLGAAAIFASNLYGIELTFWQFVLIILTSTVAAIGAAGVPGSALFVMALVMSSIGIPLTVIGIIAAVDRIIDMMTTTLNITGDAATAVIVAESEGMLDKEIYYSKPK